MFNLNTPIIRGESMGGVEIGDSYTRIVEKFKNFSDTNCKKILVGNTVSHHYFPVESKELWFNSVFEFLYDLIEGKVTYIGCQNGYQGKFMDNIEIGSTKKELLNIFSDLTEHPLFDGVFYSPSLPGIEFLIVPDNTVFRIAVYDPIKIFHGPEFLPRK